MDDLPVIVHQLVEHDGRASVWVLKARCGFTVERHGYPEDFPASMTGWASKVSCLDCIMAT